MAQLDLFPPPPLDTAADAALAAKRPPVLRLGTSSWTFPGWAGLVYRGRPSNAELIDTGLEEYSRHPLFNTVGIDRSHYAPLNIDELAKYARQLPAGYKCVTKVWHAVTSLVDPKTRQPNPHFLDARFFRDAVLVPSDAAFVDHQGPFVFQMLPLSHSEMPQPDVMIAKLDRFLGEIPKHHQYALEVRNAELLKPSYFEVLRKHGVAHVFTHWSRMPSVGSQLAQRGAVDAADFAVCRLNLPPGGDYEEMREAFAPFDRIQAPDPAMREDVVRLIELCAAAGKPVWVTVNNKTEGSSPLTVRALLTTLAAATREPAHRSADSGS